MRSPGQTLLSTCRLILPYTFARLNHEPDAYSIIYCVAVINLYDACECIVHMTS